MYSPADTNTPFMDTAQPVARAAPTGRVGIVSTFPPTRCGIARFSSSFVSSLRAVAPDLSLDIVRLINGRPPSSALGQVGMEIDPNSPVSTRVAARHLNKSDVVVLQHEFGIFGANDGESVLDMTELIDRPLITVLHTVSPTPTDRQRMIMEKLHQSSRLVVLSESARSALTTYSIPRSEVVVIPHGSPWSATPPPVGPPRSLITWGLLGPGKGLERSIEAISLLRDLEPKPHYRIVGRTHPVVAKSQGLGYRRMLETLVRDLEVEDMVEFVDRYLGDDELLDLVKRSHAVVVPYDNHDQVTSGVLTDAVAAGRPIVATRFPHAEELVGPGLGMVVDHDSAAVARGLKALMEIPDAYEKAVAAAAASSPEFSWEAGAVRYAEFLRSLVPGHITVSN